MFDLPFDQPGRFWRGNLHTHSDRSDGALPPGEVVRRYREAGYDFLAITDHFRAEYGFPLTDTRPLRTPGFTTLLGAELHAPRTEYVVGPVPDLEVRADVGPALIVLHLVTHGRPPAESVIRSVILPVVLAGPTAT